MIQNFGYSMFNVICDSKSRINRGYVEHDKTNTVTVIDKYGEIMIGVGTKNSYSYALPEIFI